jgi:hypothetical protein
VIAANVVKWQATAGLNTPVGLYSLSIDRNVFASVRQLCWVWQTNAGSRCLIEETWVGIFGVASTRAVLLHKKARTGIEIKVLGFVTVLHETQTLTDSLVVKMPEITSLAVHGLCKASARNGIEVVVSRAKARRWADARALLHIPDQIRITRLR